MNNHKKSYKKAAINDALP